MKTQSNLSANLCTKNNLSRAFFQSSDFLQVEIESAFSTYFENFSRFSWFSCHGNR